jgi:hypothetical protein
MIKLLQLFFIIFNNFQAQKSGVLKSASHNVELRNSYHLNFTHVFISLLAPMQGSKDAQNTHSFRRQEICVVPCFYARYNG